jgi:hypothetical protein
MNFPPTANVASRIALIASLFLLLPPAYRAAKAGSLGYLALSGLTAVAAQTNIPAPATDETQNAQPPLPFMRAVVIVYGVANPGSTYNLGLAVRTLPGIQDYRYDLRPGRLTIDFRPGVKVTAEDIRRAVAKSGFTPGPVELIQVDPIR